MAVENIALDKLKCISDRLTESYDQCSGDSVCEQYQEDIMFLLRYIDITLESLKTERRINQEMIETIYFIYRAIGYRPPNQPNGYHDGAAHDV